MNTIYEKDYFENLSLDELTQCEGGTFWGKVSGAATIVGGLVTTAAGVAGIISPDPATTVGGWKAVGFGVSTIGTGIAIWQNN